jgi:hypothetical protein
MTARYTTDLEKMCAVFCAVGIGQVTFNQLHAFPPELYDIDALEKFESFSTSHFLILVILKIVQNKT